MRRFLSTLVLDAVIQARNSLYGIGLGMALVWGVAARFALDGEALGPWLAPLLLMHLGSTTYFFMAALIIFEREQETLAAQSITPLRFSEYLGSKLVSLSCFGALESVLMLALAGALGKIHWALLFLAIAVLGTVYGLLAFVQALPCRSVTEFLIPNAMVMGALLALPALPYFGFWQSSLWQSLLWFLVPTYGPFLLLVSATVGLPTGELIAALVASAFWLAVGWRLARRSYGRLWLKRETGGMAAAVKVTA